MRPRGSSDELITGLAPFPIGLLVKGKASKADELLAGLVKGKASEAGELLAPCLPQIFLKVVGGRQGAVVGGRQGKVAGGRQRAVARQWAGEGRRR